jgi:co-chaperonin GroES (HSP10)
MKHDVEPKEKLFDELGDLSGLDIFNNQVLVAVYKRPEKTRGGLFLPDNVRDEDNYQGKVGLVVKLGPQAFVSTPEWTFTTPIYVGNWVILRPSDGWSINVNGVLCRMLVDTSVKGWIASPDFVY